MDDAWKSALRPGRTPYAEIKIVIPRPAVARGAGRASTRGYCVMLGYLNDEGARRRAIDPAVMIPATWRRWTTFAADRLAASKT
jgi:hypothetical protein